MKDLVKELRERIAFTGGVAGHYLDNRLHSKAVEALEAIDPDNAETVRLVATAYREGMRQFLDSMTGDSIGAINEAMGDAGARAALAALGCRPIDVTHGEEE